MKKKNLIVLIVIILFVSLGIVVLGRNIIIMFERESQSSFNDLSAPMSDKPIIYLYPEEEIQIEVKLGAPELLTHTYPKYDNSWQVIAKSNGDLLDIETGRNLYALYWEGINQEKELDMTQGFVVKGEDTIKFLEEKLEILGLSEYEAEEFIIYWLPKMENNKYNFIYFESMEEIEEGMPLTITPKPKTLIRVMMNFKALDKEIEVKEQVLSKVEREGYTVVEWGGSQY